MTYLRITNIAIFLLLTGVQALAQNPTGDKEVIIIEKIVDENGNVISKNTKRYNGSYNEDDIRELLDEESLPYIRSFDLDGLGFGDDLSGLFGSRSTRPTIGINLDFEDGSANVAKVNASSGASSVDIRVGDQLISINDIAITTIEDIHDVLDQKSAGDVVRIVVFRDGEELEKQVVLGSKGGPSFFDFSDGGIFQGFGRDGFDDQMDIDSLFRGLFDSSDLLDGFDLLRPRGFGRNDRGEGSVDMERPSLGVFLDDVNNTVEVAEVVTDSPADHAGVRTGDIIMRMDDNIVSSFREVSAYMNTKSIGDTLSLEIDRAGQIIKLEARLERE